MKVSYNKYDDLYDDELRGNPDNPLGPLLAVMITLGTIAWLIWG